MPQVENAFLGVLSGNSSAAIRNRSFVSENPSEVVIDARAELLALRRGNFVALYRFVKGLSMFARAGHAVVSTNPKWLVIFALLLRRDFTLLMGDPFQNDVSRRTSALESFLWRLIILKSPRVLVTSPLLLQELLDSYGYLKVGLYFRRGFEFPAMGTQCCGGFSYFGDMGNDRESESLMRAFRANGYILNVYGCGHRRWESSEFQSYVRYFPRVDSAFVPNLAIESYTTIILANREGAQVPGKYFDFLKFPGRVLVIGFDDDLLRGLPTPSNYQFVANDYAAINLCLKGKLTDNA